LPGLFVALLDQLFRAYDESSGPDATICRADAGYSREPRKQSLPPAFLPSHAVTLLNVDLARGSHGGPSRDPQFLLIADI